MDDSAYYEDSSMSRSVSVIGAGSIGISTALHLQQRGWQVTLIDRKAPGRETSFGNAGIINNGSMVALNNPGMHKSLPSYLKNNKPQLRYNLKYIVKNLPWTLQFLQSSKTRSAELTASALHSLTSVALQEHKAFMQRAGNLHRLSEVGWLRAYRQGPGFDETSFEGRQFAKHNVPYQKLTANELHDLEPSLKRIYSAGFIFTGAASINNPGKLMTEYAEQFVKDGGTLKQAEIKAIESNENNTLCRTDSGTIESDAIVVAAGPWSNDILAMLDYSVLLRVERGYHAHYNLMSGAALTRSVYDVQSGFIMSPMEMGIRITTGVDLNHRDAKPNHSQLKQVLPSIKEAIDLGPQTDLPIWNGNRPTLPDSRPAIGQAPNHKNVWVAFGHQHIGLMTGPITGKLLAEQMSGETSEIDLAPFNPGRFMRSTRRRKPIWAGGK